MGVGTFDEEFYFDPDGEHPVACFRKCIAACGTGIKGVLDTTCPSGFLRRIEYPGDGKESVKVFAERERVNLQDVQPNPTIGYPVFGRYSEKDLNRILKFSSEVVKATVTTVIGASLLIIGSLVPVYAEADIEDGKSLVTANGLAFKVEPVGPDDQLQYEYEVPYSGNDSQAVWACSFEIPARTEEGPYEMGQISETIFDESQPLKQMIIKFKDGDIKEIRCSA